jgi:divalent metal cation (Fe/Co/Zn/Cd) transporter
VTTRAVQLRRALVLSVASIAWNGVAGAVAVVVAVTSGSLSLLGFGVDAVIDSAASVALIARFLIEARQPGRAARVEHVAERVVGAALLALAIYLIVGSIRALAAQEHASSSVVGVGLLVASAVALPPLALAKYRVAARLGSRALRADSILTGVAALLAVISLSSLAAADLLGLWWADAVAALIVAMIVMREGWGSFAISRSNT